MGWVGLVQVSYQFPALSAQNRLTRRAALRGAAALVATAVLAACGGTPTTITVPSATIPPSLFGMHIHRAASTTPWPAVPFAAWRLWDASVTWADLEPQRGEWHWEALDRSIALAEEHGIEPLLPLGVTPTWASARPTESSVYQTPGGAAEPRDLNDWRTYVRMVAARYRSRIRHYEIWNEPNSNGAYSGTVEGMVALAREASTILKGVDSAITVVSPSATGGQTGPAWLAQYLKSGGGVYADIIGYHFYVSPQPPEAVVPLIAKVREIASQHSNGQKPVWDTEIGWSSSGSLRKIFSSDVEAAAYVARTYLLHWANGVARCYWYAWDNRGWSSLYMVQPDSRTPTPAANAYGQVQQWLVGAQIAMCGADRNKNWVCQLTRDADQHARILWNPDKTTTYALPVDWQVARQRDLDGTMRDLAGVKTVTIGPSPILLESRPATA